MVKNLALIAIALALLTTCASPPSTLKVETAAPKGTGPSLEGMPPDAVLVYHRSGGIAGIDEVWTVYADGSITNTSGALWQAPQEQVEALLQTIDGLGFFDMDASYLPKDVCCDRFSYELSVQYEGQAHQVVTMDGTETTPEAFWKILDEVQRFVDEFAG
jgi:hypothetical protein